MLERVTTHADLKAAWPQVKVGLEQIIKRCPGTPWTADSVYWRIARDQCALFVCEDGFFIAERCVEPHSEAWFLNVWCMYFKPGKARERMADLIAQIDDLQEQMFCKFTQFSSPRLGWGRAMKDHFKLHLCIWRREKNEF